MTPRRFFYFSVMPVAFSDSEWEKINYEESSPFVSGPTTITRVIDEDDIGPSDSPEGDILYGSDDNDDAESFGQWGKSDSLQSEVPTENALCLLGTFIYSH